MLVIQVLSLVEVCSVFVEKIEPKEMILHSQPTSVQSKRCLLGILWLVFRPQNPSLVWHCVHAKAFLEELLLCRCLREDLVRSTFLLEDLCRVTPRVEEFCRDKHKPLVDDSLLVSCLC